MPSLPPVRRWPGTRRRRRPRSRTRRPAWSSGNSATFAKRSRSSGRHAGSRARPGIGAGKPTSPRAWAWPGSWPGSHAEALRDARAAVDLLAGAGDLVWEARAVVWRAAVYLAIGDIERADRDYARAERLYAECGQQLEYASARQERGLAAHARGDLPTALAHLDSAQILYDQLGTFEAELFVNKCTVLLAAGLARDALSEVNTAVS